ncbi:Poly polymerase 3 [Hibiscus syriacus]|uniref:Poly [ADP-ribose] polymerase n=1 Tax=Hibiscus syriacus TaxID=106335 RepID=A0A6A2ZCN2_HIBSY|nr:Poly polymerase 3 [Hibiscus syriacus]
MKLHETRAHAHGHGTGDEEKIIMTRKQKAEQLKSNEGKESPKKPKVEDGNDQYEEKATSDVVNEFEEFCKAIRENLSIAQMREILEANGQDSSGSDASVAIKCLDMLFYGPLEKCQICNGDLEFDGNLYSCKGTYSEWSSCVYKTRSPARKQEPPKLPDSATNSPVANLLEKYEVPCVRPHRNSGNPRSKNMGGKSPTRYNLLGCSSIRTRARRLIELIEAMERGVRVVSETWLLDSIEKQEAQPLEAYDIVTDLSVDGKGIPWDKQAPDESALESFSAELKLYGKRGVYKDTRLQEQGGQIFEKDGILYNCAFSLCDQGRSINEYCIMQLIKVPDCNLHLYYKKGRVGDDPNAQEKLDEWKDIDGAVKEFVRLFEEVTGNEFEPWEREKKFQKKQLKFYPIDMDDGVDVRCGGLGLRQLGVAAAHCKLEPMVANFIKVLCSQEIYKYALMEMDLDAPDLPMGMLSDVHLKKIPFIFRDYQEFADHCAASFECVRDIVVASHVIGHMGDDTLDDPLSDRYKRIGCSISPVDKDSDDHKMILNYVEKTFEPVKVADIEYGISVENIFSVETKEGPSFEEVKKLPNKRLLWCSTRSSNLLRHLHKGFLPASCSLPVPGYRFGKGIVCSDAAAEAARYGFTAVDRAECFMVLAVFSQGEEIIELKDPPEDTKQFEEKKACVKRLGRKKPDESEFIDWKDDIKVPCGRLIPSEHKDSPLEYNEYTVYDPKQVCMKFLVGVKFEEKGAVIDTED